MHSNPFIPILQDHIDRIISMVQSHTDLIRRIISRLEIIENCLDGHQSRPKTLNKKSKSTARLRMVNGGKGDTK